MVLPSLTDEQRLAWLRLTRSERVGPVTFFNFINRFGSAQNALDALPDIMARSGAKSEVKICTKQDAERELAEAAKLGVRHIAAGEPDYPRLLRHIDDPPTMLLTQGTMDLNERPMVAIVGSRNTSIAGQKIAGQIARGLVEAGYVVVSGLARGIDTAAHQGALSGGTAAVLAGGHAQIYPAENVPLAKSIIDHSGAIISETPPWLSPRAQDFPRRNRIVSGLSNGVLVVEAARRSGSLITARLAGEQNRHLFAIPGSPLDPRSEGTNKLIREGATLARSADDIVEDLRPLHDLSESAPLGDQLPYKFETGEDGEYASITAESLDIEGAHVERIINGLSAAPVHIDDIVRFTGFSPQFVVACLCELEFSGRVERLDANMFKLA